LETFEHLHVERNIFLYIINDVEENISFDVEIFCLCVHMIKIDMFFRPPYLSKQNVCPSRDRNESTRKKTNVHAVVTVFHGRVRMKCIYIFFFKI